MNEIRRVTQVELWSLVSAGVWDTLQPEEKARLEQCLRMTADMWAGTVDGDLVCVFGVAPQTLMSNSAYVWVWHTSKLAGHEFVFIRHSQLIVAELLKRFTTLYGVCDKDAEQSIRWVKWLGAEFGPRKNGMAPFEIKAA